MRRPTVERYAAALGRKVKWRIAKARWALICSPIDIEVVRVLRATTRPLTGREVARLSQAGSQPTVNSTLRRLAEEGVVHAEKAGSAYLYTLNREHLAAPAIEQLADIRSELR